MKRRIAVLGGGISGYGSAILAKKMGLEVFLSDSGKINPEYRRRMDQWGVHGRGMALYSIRHNALEAYVVSTMVNGGTAISVSFDTNSLSERADDTHA